MFVPSMPFLVGDRSESVPSVREGARTPGSPLRQRRLSLTCFTARDPAKPDASPRAFAERVRLATGATPVSTPVSCGSATPQQACRIESLTSNAGVRFEASPTSAGGNVAHVETIGASSSCSGAATPPASSRHHARSIPWASVVLKKMLSDSGGTADVYAGVFDGAPVAVKRLRVESQARLANFRREIEVLQRLSHRRVISLKAFIHEEPLALVLERVTFPRHPFGHFPTMYEFMWQARHGEGSSLGVWASSRWAWTQQLLQAIAYVHSKQVLHLDVKTQNLMLDEEGMLKLIDFGCAQIVDHTMQLHLNEDLTGTPRYLPPEILQAPVIARDKTDIWSVGCCMIELLGGPVPFEHLLLHEEVLAALQGGDRPKILLDAPFQNCEAERMVYRALSPNWMCRPTAKALMHEAFNAPDPGKASNPASSCFTPVLGYREAAATAHSFVAAPPAPSREQAVKAWSFQPVSVAQQAPVPTPAPAPAPAPSPCPTHRSWFPGTVTPAPGWLVPPSPVTPLRMTPDLSPKAVIAAAATYTGTPQGFQQPLMRTRARHLTV
mmetsp:Transcript_39137/g.92068  ORF Transcript_39137/g.92068 Transcript_39137/m.92068 type:complete len:553 (-) Transcript_39137:293-1951(-)